MDNAQNPAQPPQPGEIEYEFGVPIPGTIKPAEEWTRTAIKHLQPPGPLEWTGIFGRAAPLVLELACGNGRYTLLSALNRPDHDHFATDILPTVIRYATRRANQRGLPNVRFAVKDAETLMRTYVAPGSVAEIHLYHPQPYHDPRMANRRLVTPRFLADVHRALQPRGLFVIQTDNPGYWEYMARILPEFFEFHVQETPWPDAPAGRSRREILARSRGFAIFRGYGFRRDELTAEQLQGLTGTLPPPRFHSHGPWCELDRIEEEGAPKRRGWRGHR